MSTDTSLIGSDPPKAPSTLLWLGGTAAFVAGWALIYGQLVPFSEWAVSWFPLEPKSHAYEAVKFFLYDTPKVLMLLTLVVFGMGMVRSFFSPNEPALCSPDGAKASVTSPRQRSAFSHHSVPARLCRYSWALYRPEFHLGSRSRF